MNFKKLLATILATVMLLSSCLLVSCDKAPENADSSATAGSQATDNANGTEIEKGDWDKTAKIIILAGQSNMAGSTNKSYIRTIKDLTTAKKKQLLLDGFPNIKIMFNSGSADAPSSSWHTSYDKLEKVVAGQGAFPDKSMFGPELGLADYLDEKYPGETFYIVKHALGGSFIDEYLSNPMAGRNDSYVALTYLMNNAIPAVEADSGLKAEVVAFCWMQGESDAMAPIYADAYYEKLGTLVDKIRTDYGQYAPANGIAFIDATVNNTGIWVSHDIVNNAKTEYQASNPSLNYLIDTNAEGLTCANEPKGNPDLAHYDSMSQLMLGRLFGENVSAALEKAYKKG